MQKYSYKIAFRVVNGFPINKNFLFKTLFIEPTFLGLFVVRLNNISLCCIRPIVFESDIWADL